MDISQSFGPTDLEVTEKKLQDEQTSEAQGTELAEYCMCYLSGYRPPYSHDSCTGDSSCKFRHEKPKERVVCKYWYRGLCQQGPRCKFLHICDASLLPPCKYFQKDSMFPTYVLSYSLFFLTSIFTFISSLFNTLNSITRLLP